jgi:hypothetical protein
MNPRSHKAFPLTAAVAIALALVLLTGATLTAASGPTDVSDGTAVWSPGSASANGRNRFVDKHGLVLRTPQLHLAYWGTAWMPQSALTPTSAQVTRAVRTMIASAYMTGLAQYRGIQRGYVRGAAVITSSDPPARFTDEQVARFVDDQLTAGTIPGPDADNQTLYGVVMPKGVKPRSSDWVGEHNYYVRWGQRIHYAWFADSDDLPGITGIVSHELVEAATDPEGDGFRGVKGACSGPGWCEIADVCASTSVLDGITVQSYWSNQAGACIVPVASSEKTDLSRTRPRPQLCIRAERLPNISCLACLDAGASRQRSRSLITPLTMRGDAIGRPATPRHAVARGCVGSTQRAQAYRLLITR